MKHYRRGFLNDDEGIAAFETEVRTSSEWRQDGDNDYMSAGITLTDCSRRIYLEFDVDSSAEQLEQRKRKVSLLLEVVQEFHDKFMEGASSLVFKEKGK